MMLRTSDLAICAETSTSSIREYSDQGLLGPIFRAENSNYRMFDPRIIPQLYLIKGLRELGFSPRQLKEFGQNRSPEQAVDIFKRYSTELQQEISKLQTQLDMLRSYAELIEEGQCAQPGTIEVRSLRERRICYGTLQKSANRKRREYYRLHRAHEQIRQNGNAGCPLGFAYNEFFDLLENPDQPAQLVSYDPQGRNVRPAGEYLIGTESSFYGEKDDLPRRMFEYALRNNLEFCGPVHIVYLLDAASVTGKEQYLVQTTVAVKKIAG